MKISSSYYWPGLFRDVKKHVQTCLTCQQRKRATIKPTQLQLLPIPKRPNWRIHADLFGPMLTADSNKKFVLCITDAFTKYAVVTSIQNKNAETVADAIFKEWFCKFGIPAQIHTDKRQRICEQALGRDDGTHERRAHQNVTGSPTMQCSSGGFQQTSEKISGVICGRYSSKLGDISTSPGA